MLDSVSAASGGTGLCTIALDAAGIPHLLYTIQETYKGVTYTTLTYANKVGGTWSKVSVWPKEKKLNFSGAIAIAIGPDNLPYLRMGTQLLKGNSNKPTMFDAKDLGATLTSFVIHANGDVRASLTVNGNYANYLHDHSQAWTTGWTLSDSGSPETSSGVLVLSNNAPYAVRRQADGIWLQKGYEPPFLAIAQPSGTIWQTVGTRWNAINYYNPGRIDLTLNSWDGVSNHIWYAGYSTPAVADFTATPAKGLGPLTVSFHDASLPAEGQSISSWEWDFTNNGTIDATIPNPAYTYTTPGKHTVRLKVTDTLGTTDTKIKTDLVEVMADSDGDGIPDPQDNCPNDYNPLQTDLNSNGIGDTCEPVANRVAKVAHMTGLRSYTASDARKSTEITAIMKDGLLDQGPVVAATDGSAISIQLNKDARAIKKLILRMYINGIAPYNPTVGYIYIMPYKSDLSTTLDLGLSGGYNGWNEIDVTSLMHRMDGFGTVKFRVMALRQSFSIREIELIEKADQKEISVTPASIDFGTLSVTNSSEQQVDVYNNGSETVTIAKVVVSSQPYSLTADSCTGTQLPQYASCAIKVKYAPTIDGRASGELSIRSDDADRSDLKVPLLGTAVLELNGRLRDQDTGAPLYHATIELIDGSNNTITTTSDASGYYSLTGLSTGSYTITVSRFDYRTKSMTGLMPSGTISTLDMLLQKNRGSIEGIVTDPVTGAPAAGVTVSLSLAGIKTADIMAACLTSAGPVDLPETEHRKLYENDGAKTNCNNITFKARNPDGLTEPFTFTWNGNAALVEGTEYLAQKFRPAKTGNLTKISIDSGWFGANVVGGMHVLVKSALGGDRGTHLAKSNEVYFNNIRSQTSTLIDFTFPEPPSVTAGVDYFFEINGYFYETGNFLGFPTQTLYNLPWKITDSPQNGAAFKRSGGIWNELPTSLAFTSYIDGQQDITTIAGTATEKMYGGNWVFINGNLLNPHSNWSPLVGIDMSGRFVNGSDGQAGYNGDDFTVQERFADNTTYYRLNQFYNSEYWVGFNLASDSNTTSLLFGGTAPSALLTDYVTVTFERTLTTPTDSSGHYLFANLPGGEYTIAFNKPGAYSTATGALAYGEQKQINRQLTSIPLLQVNITSPPNGAAFLNTSYITVTGTINNAASVTLNGSPATVTNNTFSATVFVANGVNTITAIATDQYGQTATSSITVIVPAPPIISNLSTVSVSADSAVIAWDTDQLATSTVEYGTISSYGNTITDSHLALHHEVTVRSLQPGTTYHFRIVTQNAYGHTTSSSDSTFDTDTFGLKVRGDSGNTYLLELIGSFDGKTSDGSINSAPRKAVTAEYFRTHPDKDFLVFLSTFDYAMPEAGAQGYYTEVKNDTQGINRTMLNNSSQYGSPGMLQGTIDLGNITQLASNPYGPKLEETITTLNHELGHRWLAAVRFKNTDGTLNTSLIGKDNAHWSYLLDSKGSLMYGNGWKDNANGSFTSVSKQSAFSPLDLYLMGLLDKSQVSPMLLIDNPAIDKTKLPTQGDTITGIAQTVTIDDIIAAEGPRIPDYTAAQKQFTVGFVLLSRTGDDTTAATAAIETLRKAWAGKFAELTRGKGSIAGVAPSLEVTVESPTDNATITGPDVTVSGTVINSSGAETGVTVNGIPATISGSRFIANHVPLQAGSNSISVTATDVNGLTTTATRTVTALAGNYIRISGNLDSGTGPLNISLRLDGSFTVANPTISVQGPVSVPVQQDTQADSYTATLNVEGTYVISASAQGPDMQTYTDSVTVTVVPRYQLETLLKGKWEGMKAKIAAGDVEGAVQQFISTSRSQYQSVFTDPTTDVLARLNEISALEVYTVLSDTAQGGAIRQEADGEYAYPVNFIRDENGVWRISGF